MEIPDNTATSNPHLWIIQHCTRAGCSSAIRSRHGLTDAELICQWCHAKEEHGCPFAVYPTHIAHDQVA
jgi:hypothetical protein